MHSLADLCLTKNELVLLVIDMQNAFLADGGYYDLIGKKIAPEKRDSIVKNCRALITRAHEKNLHVIFVKTSLPSLLLRENPDFLFRKRPYVLQLLQKAPAELAKTLYISGEWGEEIIPELPLEKGDLVISKVTYDAFESTQLDFVLRRIKIKHILLVGIFSNICIDCTAKRAFCLGYNPVVVSDATAGTDEFLHIATLRNIQQNFGWVLTTSEALDLLTAL